MTDQRRLIQDAAPGELRHRLLRAGREAAPTAESRQRLLGAVLPLMDVPALNAGASKGSLEAAASSLKASLASKLAVLSVVGAAATGAWYATGTHGADGASSAPAPTVAASEQKVPIPAVRNESHAAAASAGRAPGAPTLPVEGTEHALQSPLPHWDLTAAPARPVATELQPLAHNGSRQRPARAQRSISLHPTREPAKEQRSSQARHDSPAQLPEPLSAQPPSPGASAEAATSVAQGSTLNSPADTYLREELKVLDAVRGALRSGDRVSARQHLDHYFQRFPHGFLAPEARRLDQKVRDESAR